MDCLTRAGSRPNGQKSAGSERASSQAGQGTDLLRQIVSVGRSHAKALFASSWGRRKHSQDAVFSLRHGIWVVRQGVARMGNPGNNSLKKNNNNRKRNMACGYLCLRCTSYSLYRNRQSQDRFRGTPRERTDVFLFLCPHLGATGWNHTSLSRFLYERK